MFSSHTSRKLRRLNLTWHRDLGYFFSSLIIIYCLSGLALNHLDDWDPDFIIYKKTVHLPAHLSMNQVTDDVVTDFSKAVEESHFKIYDFPTDNQVKIYYDNASLHVNLETGTGHYERIGKRHFFYEANVLHRNSLAGWKWMSDIFAVMLIAISVTGLFILRGKYGFRRRGVWFTLAGLLLPVAAVWLFYYFNS
ncbi:MAG: PepSY-associated TM helix domain-containing protein [Chitinophagaceae bacterium]|nr:PepSY-associated TM helix domain-containing protein [Chitinophagaceae bacterium]